MAQEGGSGIPELSLSTGQLSHHAEVQEIRNRPLASDTQAQKPAGRYDMDESKQAGGHIAAEGSGSSSMACGAVHRQTPEAGARCVNSARRDL